MSLTLTADVSQAIAAMNKAISNVGNKQPVMAEMAAYGMQTVLDRFNDQRDPDGKSWEALSPASLVRKSRNGTIGNGILVEHGTLVGNMKLAESAYGFSIDNPTPYAAIHQTGNKFAGLPARPFMGWGDNDEAKLHEIMTAWLTRGIA